MLAAGDICTVVIIVSYYSMLLQLQFLFPLFSSVSSTTAAVTYVTNWNKDT